MIEHIQWLGHGSFLIQSDKRIYINPWRITRQPAPADLVLISHDHYEHFSLADIAKIRGPHTQVITNQRVAKELEGVTVLRPWHSITSGRISVKAVPAYSPHSLHHPEQDGGLGFIISVNFYDIYYAGDTQLTPEMKTLRPDIAILPIDGNGTLTVEEAAEAVQCLRPRWMIPSNWGTQPGGATPLDVLRLRELTNGLTEIVAPKRTVQRS